MPAAVSVSDIPLDATPHTQTSSVALLTGGSDKPYAAGLASALSARGIAVDFVGSDELNCQEIRRIHGLTFLNLRGDQREDAKLPAKVVRVLTYYGRLLHYAATASPPIVHILWNNKFDVFDRTLLMAYYRAVGRRVVLTAHNVNAAARDGKDSWINRLSLRIQYRLCNHVFVHTEAMKRQLTSGFGVPDERVTVIPFGINDTIPRTGMTRADARRILGIGIDEQAVLFFGQIAPYKGLEYLIAAVGMIADAGGRVRLIIAGKVKRGSEDYWRHIQRTILDRGIGDRVTQRIHFIADDEVEHYFTAADAVVLPYVNIYQSGVPFLAFSFGLPVIATDVGSLREDVTQDTGLLCKPRDPADLARALTTFYENGFHKSHEEVTARIRRFVAEGHSWDVVAARTAAVYGSLARHRQGPSVRANATAGTLSVPVPAGRRANSDPEPPSAVQ